MTVLTHCAFLYHIADSVLSLVMGKIRTQKAPVQWSYIVVSILRVDPNHCSYPAIINQKVQYLILNHKK